MALPKIDVPIYNLILPSTEEEISYRPFLVREEKILLMAMEGNDEKEIVTAIKQIINNCVLTKGIKVDKLPLFDLEYILLNLRAKSMGDEIVMNYKREGCPEKDCQPIEIKINANEIKIVKDPDHTNNIKITDSVGVIMKYPDINMMNKINNLMGEMNTEDIFEIVTRCIDKIYDDEDIQSSSDYTYKELKEFVMNLTQENFKKVESFFNTLPKLKKDVSFDCKRCGYNEKVEVEGLSNFFG